MIYINIMKMGISGVICKLKSEDNTWTAVNIPDEK